MATFDAIVANIITITGRSDKQVLIESTLTASLKELQRRDNHYFMEEIATRDLVIDQQDYDLPSDFKDMVNVYRLDEDGSWRTDPLDQLSFEEARNLWNVDDEGEPEAYTIFRDAFFVWPPKPDDDTQDLHLEYYKFLPDLVGGQSNELTVTWEDLVEAWATWRFYKKLPNAHDEALVWQELARPLYEDLVTYSNQKRLKGKYGMKIRTGPRQVNQFSRRRRFDWESY